MYFFCLMAMTGVFFPTYVQEDNEHCHEDIWSKKIN